MTPQEIEKRVFQLQIERGYASGIGLIQMEEGWKGLVEDSELGYTYGHDEFSNDLSVREYIEIVLSDAGLAEEPSVQHLSIATVALDKRFKDVSTELAPEFRRGQPWWLRRVLHRACPEYAEDVKQLFGLDIKACDT